ncbi:MAG: prenyltransferase [Nannocystaceae bacterium]
MHPALQPWSQRWLFALKVASWPKLLAPALLGQAIGLATVGAFSPLGALFGGLHCMALACAVVLLNDYGDQSVDALKRDLFPSSSPKTIPDGVLSAQAVALAGMGAAAITLALAVFAESALGRPGAGVAAGVALFTFAAYSFRPLRLNYRGGGELLEMLGVGVVLPLFNAYLQGGVLLPPLALAVLPGLVLLSLASAISSGLADEVSDRQGGKITFTTRYGNSLSRAAGENLLIGGALLWAFAARMVPEHLASWVVLPAVVVLISQWRSLVTLSEAATTYNFDAIRRYKRRLNHTIALAASAMASAMVIAVVLKNMTLGTGP